MSHPRLEEPVTVDTTLDDEPRVRYEKHDRVAYVTLNRPHVLNAIDARMHEELQPVWDDFETDDDVLVGVLTGAGDRAFSTGQDLAETAERIRAGTWRPAVSRSRR